MHINVVLVQHIEVLQQKNRNVGWSRLNQPRQPAKQIQRDSIGGDTPMPRSLKEKLRRECRIMCFKRNELKKLNIKGI